MSISLYSTFYTHLQTDTLTQMFAPAEWGSIPFRPIFNCYPFPFAFISNFTSNSAPINSVPIQILPLITDLFLNRAHLSLEDAQRYNSFVRDEGCFSSVKSIPDLSSKGQCIYKQQTVKHPYFKSPDHHTCLGCGRTMIPGSLADPACKTLPYPWWLPFMADEISDTLQYHSGVSSTDPLYWFGDGVYRHGRTLRHPLSLKDQK